MQGGIEEMTKVSDNDLAIDETKVHKMDLIENTIRKAKQLDGLGTLIREFGEYSNGNGLHDTCCVSIGEIIEDLSHDIYMNLEINWDLLISKVKEKGSSSTGKEGKEPEKESL